MKFNQDQINITKIPRFEYDSIYYMNNFFFQ